MLTTTTTTSTTSTRAAPKPVKSKQPWTLEIRALYDDTSIIVYQAYSEPIATAAVTAQCLSASPAFRPNRMTWIKPSWAWMMYRSFYSYKDPRQARILAIRMSRAGFHELLRHAILADNDIHNNDHADDQAGGYTSSSSSSSARKQADKTVRVQWDPERTPRLARVENVRSIQIGISGAWVGRWVDGMILAIEDVTPRARELKATLDREPDLTDGELIERGLLPEERPYELPGDIRAAVQRHRRGEATAKEEAKEEAKEDANK